MLMRWSSLALALVLLLPACGDAPAPSAQSPSSSQQPQPAPTVDYAAQAAEAQQRQIAAIQAQEAAQSASFAKAAAEAKAQHEAKRDAAEAELRQRCDSTREKRVANARSAMKQRIDVESKLKARAKEVVGACKLVDRPTGAVNIQPSGRGVRVSREMQDDVVCARGVPAGFTKQEVWVVLARVREGNATASIDPTSTVLEAEDHDADDAACVQSDTALGLNLYLQYNDAEALRRLLTWKPSP